MELWIRSQNQLKLVEVNSIITIEYSPRPDITGYQMYVDNNCIGEYKTKERALEVLNEIYEILQGTKILEVLNKKNGNMDNLFPILTYEMPEE